MEEILEENLKNPSMLKDELKLLINYFHEQLLCRGIKLLFNKYKLKISSNNLEEENRC